MVAPVIGPAVGLRPFACQVGVHCLFSVKRHGDNLFFFVLNVLVVYDD